MKIAVITLFPEMLDALKFGIVGRALQNKLISLSILNPRSFTTDKRQTVDDRPYGGGPGMLMKVEPLREAIHQAKQNLGKTTQVSYLSPQGKPFNQNAAIELSQRESLILVAGRYEGIDERLMHTDIDEEWSIGDYVLSGGELAIMVMIDTIARLLPGALGHEESSLLESFMTGLLDYPHYTRPEEINGLKVPDVLLSGNHKDIEQWRLKQALGRTWLKRPDLLEKRKLTKVEQDLLTQFINEQKTRKSS